MEEFLDKDEFIKYFSGNIWKHIFWNTQIPYEAEKIPPKKEFLEYLFNKIIRMEYSPSIPRGMIISHKRNLVVRFIPVLKSEDICVYYFCIKVLEKFIAVNRVKGTYGGWSLGGVIRKIESLESYGDVVGSAPDSSYNKFAWKKSWTDYQNKAYELYQDKTNKEFIIFDIANFYDNIRLDRLEAILRGAVTSDKSAVVNLLFYFLFHWNKKYLYYERQSTGLPQDEVGDCSRILANFYLQEYDLKMHKLRSEFDIRYLRYSDDQIIAGSSPDKVRKTLFLASKELAKIGLNLNASKAKFFRRKDFFKFWSFDIFNLLEDPEDSPRIKAAFKILRLKINEKEDFNLSSILKRFLGVNLFVLGKSDRRLFVNLVVDKDFLLSLDSYFLGKIYRFLEGPDKRKFIAKLNKLSGTVLFNQFHLRVLKFAGEHKVPDSFVRQVRENLENIENLYK